MAVKSMSGGLCTECCTGGVEGDAVDKAILCILDPTRVPVPHIRFSQQTDRCEVL